MPQAGLWQGVGTGRWQWAGLVAWGVSECLHMRTVAQSRRVPQAQGSGDRQGQWLEGFWWHTHVGTAPRGWLEVPQECGMGGLGWGQAGTVARGVCSAAGTAPACAAGVVTGRGQRGGDRTGQRGFQSASSPRSTQRGGIGEGNRIHSGEEQGAGGAVAAPHQRAPAGQEPPGNAMRTATKPATGRGSRPGRGRERRGWAGAAATPWPGR